MTVVLLPVFLYALFRTTPVQTYIASRVASYLSTELNTTVEVGGLDISWFLRIVLVDVNILDKRKMPVIKFHRLSTGMPDFDLKQHRIKLNSVNLQGADVRLVYYENSNELNLQFLLDYFSSKDTISTASKPWVFSCKKVDIRDTRFRYRNEQRISPGKGMDYDDLDIAGIDLHIRGLNINGDSIAAEIKQLTAKEKCGFSLEDFSTRVLVTSREIIADSLLITTDKSKLSLDLKLQYHNWNGFNDFIDSVNIRANIKQAQLDLRDLVCFAPELDGMDESVKLSGKFNGTISSFNGKEILLAYGQGTAFSGSLKMTGLPHIEETFIHLRMNEFKTDYKDVQSFTLPYSSGLESIKVPVEVTRLGSVRIVGKFTGFFNDFVSNATFYTDAGVITTDILLSKNHEDNRIEYDGHLQAAGFDLGKVFNVKEIGTLNLNASVNGKGFSAKTADLTVKGKVDQFWLIGNELDELSIDGSFNSQKFSGKILLQDELINLDFNGMVDISDSLPVFNFQADLRNAMLTKLNLWERDSSSMISTHMNLDFRGNTLDNLMGSLNFENTVYVENKHTIVMNQLMLLTQSLSNNGKRMTLKSDFADAVFSGQYTFDDLTEYLTLVFTDYLPAIALVSPSLPREVKGSFDYTIQLRNTKPLTDIFVPGLQIDPNTVVSGGFDPSKGLVNVNGRSPSIRLNGFTFEDWSLQGASEGGKLGVEMNCRDITLLSDDDEETPDAHLEQFKLFSTAQNDTIKFRVVWNDVDTADKNRADFGGSLSFSSYPMLALSLDSAGININDTLWSIKAGNKILIDTTSIQVMDLQIASKYQSIAIDGRITDDPLDQLFIRLDHFNISQLDLYTRPWGIDFDGYVNGTLALSDVFHIPLIKASLLVNKLGFNHEALGDAEINSSWDNTQKAIMLDTRIVYQGNAGVHYPLLAKGAIYTERSKNNFDISVKVDNIKLKVLQPFFIGLFSRMKGYGSGDLTLTGAFENPILTGKVKLMRSELMIDYLRTSYSFTGDFNFAEDLMWFENINVADSVGNTGSTSGKISHHAFKDWFLDIDVVSNNLTVLNTTFSPAEMYYGKARANGKMQLKGPVNDLKLSVQARSVKGTDVFIPINTDVTIAENDYIYYVNTESKDDPKAGPPPEPSNLSLHLELDVSKDANLELILPYRMGNIKVKGDGAVDMGLDSKGNYSMHGQYVMDKGSFLFNFQDIFSRTFEIRKGSTITFNGSPYDADINLQAVYKIKTNLAGLSTVPLEATSKRIPVDCVISLTNSLYNPDIHFSIAMPDADAETQRWVFGAIDTSNSVAMNQQMISLLLLNSFTSSGESSNITATGLGISSFSIISNQLNNWLSQISKDFDVGVNYRPGDQMSAQELELALSTQFFNDRVVVDGTFGMTTSNTIANSQSSNQWIGDVNVEVKITEDGRFRVKAFNRTNTSIDLYTGQAPYTQGVGILYRKDFDNLRELFGMQRKAATGK
ncbi:MAG: translocation/assembly module TamB [Bacteroidales bacterium]|nr:translocation/assembly module TamB [Bacteroidales bacterium]